MEDEEIPDADLEAVAGGGDRDLYQCWCGWTAPARGSWSHGHSG